MKRYTKRAAGALNEWARRNGVPFSAPIVVAVSGGADSLALMIAAKNSRFSDITVLTVDHGIQASSAVQAQKVAQQAEELGLDCVIEKVAVPINPDKGNVEACARDGRYAIFNQYPLVLLAHTANDQIETMLLGFGRGSGSKSIQGMREFRDNKYGRPFLSLTRDETRLVCIENNVHIWDDPHNEDIGFRRVHVRRKVVPALKEVFGDGILKNFGRTATQLQEDSDALEQWAREATPDGATKTFLPKMDALPVAVQKRVLKNWLNQWNTGSEAIKSAVIETALSLENGKRIPLNLTTAVRKDSRGWHIFL